LELSQTKIIQLCTVWWSVYYEYSSDYDAAHSCQGSDGAEIEKIF